MRNLLIQSEFSSLTQEYGKGVVTELVISVDRIINVNG